MFVPYRPSDYRGLLDEFYEGERKRKPGMTAIESLFGNEKTTQIQP